MSVSLYLRKLRDMMRREPLDRELNDELGFHIEMETRKRMQAGLSEPEARREALRVFGGHDVHAEATRDARRLPFLEELLRDARITMRQLRRTPSFTVTAVGTLAIGIGMTTAVFSVVRAVILKPLPYSAPEQLVHVWPGQFMSQRDVTYMRENARSFDEFGSFSPGWLMALSGVDAPEQLDAGSVSGNLFGLLGVRPLLGSTFAIDAERPGAELVTVLSHDVWLRKFGADRGIIGEGIRLNGASYRVIGVMPKGFEILGQRSDLYIPLVMDASSSYYGGTVTQGVARLRSGTTVAAAAAETRDLARRIREQYQLNPGYAQEANVVALKESVIGSVRDTLLIVFGAVSLVLFIAATNVANLLLARSSERQIELSVRASLGATRGRIVRQLVTESCVLAMVGGLAGIGVAYAVLQAFRSFLPVSVPRAGEVSMGAGVLLIALVCTAVAAIVSGLAPAYTMTRSSLDGWLRQSRTGSRGGIRVRNAIICAEVAIAILLCTAAGLMVRTLSTLYGTDAGFDRENVVTMRMQYSMADSSAARAYWNSMLTRVKAVAGVEAAGTVLHSPLSGRAWQANIAVEGRPAAPGEDPLHATWEAVSGDYFAAMGVPLLRGRIFDARDREGSAPTMVLNDVLAKALFGDGDAIGQRITAGNATGTSPFTVIGVVGSMRHDSLTAPAGPELFVSLNHRLVGAKTRVVRPRADPASLTAAVRDAIWSVDRDVPVSNIRTMRELVDSSTSQRRAVLSLFSAFALIGTLLSFIGTYGVVGYTVRQRTRELGIRRALGATATQTALLAMRSGVMPALVGIVIGTTLALLGARVLEGLLFGISSRDPMTFTFVPACLCAGAIAASWLPARAITRMRLSSVLRD